MLICLNSNDGAVSRSDDNTVYKTEKTIAECMQEKSESWNVCPEASVPFEDSIVAFSTHETWKRYIYDHKSGCLAYPNFL